LEVVGQDRVQQLDAAGEATVQRADADPCLAGDLLQWRLQAVVAEDLPGGGKAIRAEVPLAAMFGYSTTMRSLSQGRATYTMEFKHYAEAPKSIAEAVINKYTGKEEKK